MFRTLSPAMVDEHIDAFLGIAADVPREYWTREHLLHDLPQKWELSFAVFENGEPVAYAVLSDKPPPHLHRMMVRAERRGGGLGAVMIAEAVRRAGSFTLKVHRDNVRAQRFYRRHGFATVSDGEYVTMSRE